MNSCAIMREAVLKHGFTKQRQPGLEANVSKEDSTCAVAQSQATKRAANAIDLTGMKFSFFTVVRYAGIRTKTHAMWECVCDCGSVCFIDGYRLARGMSKSCGCATKSFLKQASTRHGMTGTQVYTAWRNMLIRCYKKSYYDYDNYGGRGISVCDEWRLSFEAFYRDMGDKPSSAHQIDRIDNNGNYEPGNCRWATRAENVRNRNKTVTLTVDGVCRSMAEWAEITGIGYCTIKMRKASGWDDERCIKTPVRRLAVKR